MSGPLWAGPLHDAAYLKEMLNLAEQWAWVGSGSGTGTDLEKLLKQMIDESDPRLPFGYIKLDEVSFHPEISLLVCAIQLQLICIMSQVASRAKINSPPLRIMMETLHKVISPLLSSTSICAGALNPVLA